MSRYPSHLSPNITPTNRARVREPSGVFSLFQPQQIQQFKEAFSLIDQDRDGLVGEQDLKDTFASLGIVPSADMMEEMLTSRPGEHGGSQPSAVEDPRDRGINFAMFLTMMSEHLFEFDPEAELVEAFSSFDESDSGTVRCDEIRKWLGETGDRMSQAEIDRFLKGSFTDRQGNFNYKEWVKVLRVNEDDNDTEAQT
ncbi:EF-hand [Russula earlei]|uniref:EF-hand n=1 Tax=Russula earlei TaxID=71964 RepID=A0ACC0UAB8_9AGAM|nr:EF-hand [Russula earlei]